MLALIYFVSPSISPKQAGGNSSKLSSVLHIVIVSQWKWCDNRWHNDFDIVVRKGSIFSVPLHIWYWSVEMTSRGANRSTCLPNAYMDPSNPTGNFIALHWSLDHCFPQTETHSFSDDDKWSAIGNANFLSLFHNSDCVYWTQMEVCSITWFKLSSLVTTQIIFCSCSAILDASIK